MKMWHMALAIIFILLSQSACSVYKAASQPGPADITGIGVGSRRIEVITRLGAPKFSDTDQSGQKQDTFEFQSGFHQASKARVILYIAADVFTLCLAELILWPIELTVMERASCVAVATYDPTQRVEAFALTQKDGVQGC
ncbi:MAG: hypothetical protein AABZ34_19580 [Nitrospirota bacterium]